MKKIQKKGWYTMMNEQKQDLIPTNYHRIKMIKSILILVLLLIAVVGIFFRGYKSASEKYESVIKELEEENERLSDPVAMYEEATKEIDLSIINSQIQDIGELATVEYMYTDAGKFEDPKKIFGKEVPFAFTTKSFIAKWDGVIKAGVDVTKVTTEVNEINKEIVVYIPKADILSHEIVDDSIETLDEKDGLFNPIEVDDVREFDAISKDSMENRAIENGILDKAFDNAKNIIQKLINTDAVKKQGYTITFQTIEE